MEQRRNKVLESPLAQVESLLQEALGTRVCIKPRSKSGGRIEIEYYTSEDINRIVSSSQRMKDC